MTTAVDLDVKRQNIQPQLVTLLPPTFVTKEVHIWASPRMKPVFGGLRTTKAQTSLCIRLV